jgi:RTX calcium-binding nonapeptide repeat (4 copies)
MNRLIWIGRAWALIGLGVFLSIAQPSYAATITILNFDGAGEGFNDPSAPDPASTAGGNTGATLGAQRLMAFQFAANLWGAVLQSTVAITVDANFDPLFCDATSATLGQAGPNTFHANFAGAPVADTVYVQALANARFGADLATTINDIGAQFNSTVGTTCPIPLAWYYGLNGIPPAGTIDFTTVVLHEIAHGLGFLSLVSLQTGAKFAGLDDAYMRLLENHATGLLFPTMTDAERVAAQTAGANLHWTGTEAITCGNSALTSGRDPVTGHIEMFAPNPVQPGSSVSHFSTSLSPDQLMEPFDTGGSLLNLNALVDPCLLVDLGWTLVPLVPPPPPPPVLCDGRPSTIVGTAGNDRLLGTPVDDVIHGLGGNDIISGLGGNDVICGGPGRDRLSGNQGKDRLLGEVGRDNLRGGAGNDRLFGQSGNDAMDGQSGNDDRCNGGGGRDTAASCERTTSVP